MSGGWESHCLVLGQAKRDLGVTWPCEVVCLQCGADKEGLAEEVVGKMARPSGALAEHLPRQALTRAPCATRYRCDAHVSRAAQHSQSVEGWHSVDCAKERVPWDSRF